MNPPIVIAGAGIGGLMAAIALALRGFRVTVLEFAAEIEPIGAGLQLSPNVTRILIEHGLGEALRPHVVEVAALRVMNARSGGEIVSGDLGESAARYGAPFWTIHRGDLQRVLLDAVAALDTIDLHLGVRLDQFGVRNGKLLAGGRTRHAMVQFEAAALIGADGLWSSVRDKLGDTAKPVATGRTAWRTLIPSHEVPESMRVPAATLWLGPGAHAVHYPVRGGEAINLVVFIREEWNQPTWNGPGDGDFLARQVTHWALPIRTLIDAAPGWHKWAILDRPVLPQWGIDAVTLLGDAAHPMRPHLAQGAGMAIEDAAVLAATLAASPDAIPPALRLYENKRQERVAHVVTESARNGQRYAWSGPMALARNLALARMGGEALVRRYDWVYDWRYQ